MGSRGDPQRVRRPGSKLDPAGARWAEQIHREHAQTIFRYLLARTRDVGLAEDLTQEVFLAALTRAEPLQRDARPIEPWLYGVARRRYAEALRQRRGEPRSAPLDPETLGAREADEQVALAALLRDALSGLPPAQRRICTLRLLRGRTFAEIHEECGPSEAACRMCFMRGVRALRRSLRAAGLGDS